MGRDRVLCIGDLAAQAFEQHKLKNEGEGRWYCGRSGSGMYHFRLIAAPRCIFIYGDIGQAVLLCSEADSVKWLRQSIHERDYVMGKSRFAQRDRWGWMPQDLWHYHALKVFCRLFDES